MNREKKSWKKKISFLLIYAMLASAIAPLGNCRITLASLNTLQQNAMISSDSAVTSDDAIVASGSGMAATGDSIVTSGGSVDTSGSGVVSDAAIVTGPVMNVLSGISYDFEIGKDGAPIAFSFMTSSRSNVFHQTKIITKKASGFTVSLFDASKKFLRYQTGIGGNQTWRQKLAVKKVYYLVISGAPSERGSLLLSEILDDYGDTFSTASSISLNRSYTVETEFEGDVDVLAFTASKAVATYSILLGNVSGNGGEYAIYDKNGKQYYQYKGTVGAKGTKITPKLTPGARYYIQFTSSQTGRRILVTVSGKLQRYAVTYQLNGGKNAKGNPTSYISTAGKMSLKNPSRKGYVFCGWYMDSKFKKRSYNLYGSFKRNIRLYAKWKKAVAPKISISTVKSSKKKQMTVTWKKKSGAKGYQIIYGTGKTLKKAVKKKSTTKTSATLTRLKAGKRYYVMMRTYVKDSAGNKVYGDYSKKRSVIVREKNKTVKKKAVNKKAATKKTGMKKTGTTKKNASKTSTKRAGA